MLIATDDKWGNWAVIRAYTLQEWQTLQITSNKIISPTRRLKDPLRELEFKQDRNYYYSKNPMKTPRVSSDYNLRGISLIMIDIDNENSHNLNYKRFIQDKQRLKEKIDNLVIKGLLPNYTTFVFSGTGVQLLYEIKQVHPNANHIVKKLSQGISKIIKEHLKSENNLNMYGLDTSPIENTVGYARLGGINLKSGLQVTREHTNTKYTLEGLKELLQIEKLDITPINQFKSKSEVKHNYKIKGSYTSRHRVKVSENIRDLKQAQGKVKGFRNCVLFMYTNQIYQLYDQLEAEAKVKEFNATFIKPLTQAEVRKLTKQASERIYLYKNETLDDYMLNSKGLALTKKELIEVKRTGQLKKSDKTIEKQLEIESKKRELFNTPNLSNKDIAKTLNVTDRTVRRWRNEYKA